MTKWDFPGMWVKFHIWKSINIIHHIHKLNKKSHMIILSADEERELNKIQQWFMIKILTQLGIEGNFPNFMNNTCKKKAHN